MKKILGTAILYFAFNSMVLGQYKHDYIWMVGDPAAEPDPLAGVTVFNFNNDTLKLKEQNEGISMYFTNTSYSNQDGELLFYTNGCKVFNANHELMENGSGLNPGDAYLTGNCPDGGNSIPQGILAIPSPGDESKVYLFHQATEFADFGTYAAYFYYTIIDMNHDNGLGAVVKKNQLVLSDTFYINLNAVKHQNGEDWWIVFSRGYTNTFYKALLTPNGIDSIYSQEIGINQDQWWSGGGQTCFSPDGTRYARYNKKDQVLLYDFDRGTGELSNFKQLYADTTVGVRGGISFSPNSRFLYVSTQAKLWQFDMLAPDIQASKVMIDEWDGFTYFGFPVMFYLMQLGPDCKIYMIGLNGSKFMHVINSPDEPGQACDFRQHSLELPSINNTSIPNFPNYRLGTGYPVCDSNIVYTAGRFVAPPPTRVEVWPNPASGEVTIALPMPLRKEAIWSLHDQLGREVRRAVLSAGQQEIQVGVGDVPPGLYFWKVQGEGRQVASGKLIISK
jgi:hypothetical protein